MTPDQVAIAVFLFGSGITIALSAFVLGVTLFKDDDAYQRTIQRRRQLFWLERLIQIQRPEYRPVSWLLHGFAAALMLSGTGWVLFLTL